MTVKRQRRAKGAKNLGKTPKPNLETTDSAPASRQSNPFALVIYRKPDALRRTRLEVFTAVCSRIENGELIADAAIAEDTTRKTIWQWAREDEKLGNMYMRAREASAEVLENEALRIGLSLNPVPQHFDARLAVDTLKWAAAKRRPKVYSDRYNVEHDVGDGVLRLAEAMRAAEKRLANSA